MIIKFKTPDGAIVVTSDSRRFIDAVKGGGIAAGSPVDINGVLYIITETSIAFAGLPNRGCR